MTERGRIRRVALTGGIATGKSHVRARFETLGVPTIDADTLAREAVAPGTPGLDQVARRFGPDICDRPVRWIDSKLGAIIVFADADASRDLEAIIHPVVATRRTNGSVAGPGATSVRRSPTSRSSSRPDETRFRRDHRRGLRSRDAASTRDGARRHRPRTRRGSESRRSCRSKRKSAEPTTSIRTDGHSSRRRTGRSARCSISSECASRG